MAATALLAARPFKSFAGISTAFGNGSSSESKLVVVHTAEKHMHNRSSITQYVHNIRQKNKNTIVLNAGQEAENNLTGGIYDASLAGGEYKIVTKGKIKTGIINATPGAGVVQRVNALAAHLKTDLNCSVVVCISTLGYKNAQKADNLTLAKESTHIDIIIGGNETNYHNLQVIVLNSNNQEVIIDSVFDLNNSCGKIEIGFDRQGNKNYIGLGNHC
jgi:2',3'-cyclic-nucleotide 2'-phosphodiesterase (5'-nucleotidase family)